MIPNGLSPAIIVEDTDKAKTFYATHFDAQVTFDCGWYVNLELGDGGPTIQFMQPRSPEQRKFDGGLTYNIRFEDTVQVDAVHDRLAGAGLSMVMPLEDHPWGDRGFTTLDPYGVTLYVYATIEPNEEFKQYFK